MKIYDLSEGELRTINEYLQSANEMKLIANRET